MPTTEIPLDDRTASLLEAAGPPPLLATGDMLGGLLEDLAARHKTRQGNGWTGGLRCGFRLIDKELRGLRPRSVTVLSAEPNLGKSTLVNQIAYQTVAFPGQPAVAIYASFEDDPVYLLLKHLSRLSGWRINDLLEGQVSPQDPQLVGAVERLKRLPLFYLRGNADTTPEVMSERIREAQQTIDAAAPALLCIDYLQRFSRYAAARNIIDQIAMALSEIRGIADTTGAAVLVVGSQNRETNKGGSPTMYGGKYSGDIEYDADTLLVMNKEDRSMVTGGALPRKLTAVKTRFGGAGAECNLNFSPDQARFDDLAF